MVSLGLFGLVWVIGLGLCRAVLRAHWQDVPLMLRLGLGWAVGAATAGMITGAAVALTPHRRGWVVGLALAISLLPWLIRTVRLPAEPAIEVEARWHRVGRWAAAAAFLFVLLAWVGHGIDLGVGAPAGGWDAWSIWTHRARYLFLAPDDWTRGFDPGVAWSHPEYPVWLPSLITLGWLPAGRCVAASPVGIAVLTQVALLLLLVGFAQAASPRSCWPWVFGGFFATIPREWGQEVAWQYADRPLAVFFLAGAGCLALAMRQGRRDWLLLAGFCGGAAACTKDEGKAALVVLGAGALAAVVCSLCHGGTRRALGNLALLALGTVPGVAFLAGQRAMVPPTPNLIARMTLAPLTDLGRTRTILRFLVGCWADPATGGLWWGCGLALVLLGAGTRWRSTWLLWAFCGAQLAIYLLIFQLTPEDLAWHLDSALPRLLFHLGPIAFLAAAWMILEAREPDKIDDPTPVR